MSELKTIAIEAIQSLPDEADLDMILDEIIYHAKLMQGLDDARAGRVVSFDSIKTEFGIE